jgi:hypothetical protein
MPKIHYKLPNVFTANDIRLLPGINTVSDEALKSLMSHPGVKLRVDAGHIEVIDDKAAAGKQRAVKDVVSEVGQTFDLAALEALKDEDGRPGVVKAVDEQIAKIKAGADNAGGSGDKDGQQ